MCVDNTVWHYTRITKGYSVFKIVGRYIHISSGCPVIFMRTLKGPIIHWLPL